MAIRITKDKLESIDIAITFQGEVSGYASGSITIDKFPFAVDGNATDVGDLTQSRNAGAGQSSASSGYTSGGSPGLGNVTVDKFPFAVDGNATDVGDLTQSRSNAAGHSTATSGYTSGGGTTPVLVNTIDKFPFAVDGNATDVGDLTQGRYRNSGQNSAVSGYSSGGDFNLTALSGAVNTIDKFPFATDSNATDVGDLTQARYASTGQSSTVSGYTSGGFLGPASSFVSTIDKFPFASDANATGVGSLTQARNNMAGQQV